MEYRHSNMIITGMIASSSRFVLDMIDLSKITYHVMVAVGRLFKKCQYFSELISRQNLVLALLLTLGRAFESSQNPRGIWFPYFMIGKWQVVLT